MWINRASEPRPTQRGLQHDDLGTIAESFAFMKNVMLMNRILSVLLVLGFCSCVRTGPCFQRQVDFAEGYFNLRTIVADMHRCSAGIDTTLPTEDEGVLVAGFARGIVSNANFDGSLGLDLQKQFPIGLVLWPSSSLNVSTILKSSEGRAVTVSFVGKTFGINYDDDAVFVRATHLEIIKDRNLSKASEANVTGAAASTLPWAHNTMNQE